MIGCRRASSPSKFKRLFPCLCLLRCALLFVTAPIFGFCLWPTYKAPNASPLTLLSLAAHHHHHLQTKPHSQSITTTPRNTATIATLLRSILTKLSGQTVSVTPIMSATTSPKNKAQSLINANPVVVFSKSYCPYCQATKALLNSRLGGPDKYFLLELDQVDDGAALQDALEEMTGQRSVPNVFIGKNHIGGNSDLQSRKGDLDELLRSAGAL